MSIESEIEIDVAIKKCQDVLSGVKKNKSNKHRFTILEQALLLVQQEQSVADLKLLKHMLAEMRKGFDVFRPFQDVRKVAIFGSARIAKNTPRYNQVKDCAQQLAAENFMVITGGGGGIMQAANEGAGAGKSFGININLPMEQSPNPFIANSDLHFYCHYFFTRKVFFLKEANAVVLAAGGFGTLDEAFETLTLLQTGRNPPMPVVLLEAKGDDFWGPFVNSWMRRLVADGLIVAADSKMMFHTDSTTAAVAYIRNFYQTYHSFRYVNDWIVLRLQKALSEEALQRLNAEFSDVLLHGNIQSISNWPSNDDDAFSHMPSLRMKLDRHRMNVLSSIIRRINALSS
ncbi:MAG: LOG family protein [Mariprofundales bacterium]